MSNSRCQCGRPARDEATLCDTCLTQLRRWLGQAPALDRQLHLTVTRQTAIGGTRVGSRSTSRPVPWNEHASTVQQRLHAVLARWANRLKWGLPDGHPMLHPDMLHLDRALWLRDGLHLIRLRDWAPAMHADIHRAVADGWRAVDRPPDMLFAGPCGSPMPVDVRLVGDTIFMHVNNGGVCPTDLYAKPRDDTIQCPTCHATHDVAERRALLLSQVEDVLWPAKGISDALAGFLGTQITASAIRGMSCRGEIAPRGTLPSDRGSPTVLYRVGDVIDVLTRRARKDAALRRGLPQTRHSWGAPRGMTA